MTKGGGGCVKMDEETAVIVAVSAAFRRGAVPKVDGRPIMKSPTIAMSRRRRAGCP